ncbi:MAG: hypothetical protein ACRCZU_07330 [Selenomonadaceae bacterium]
MLAVTDIIKRVRAASHDKMETGYKDADILYVINGGIRFIRRLIKDYKPLMIASDPVVGTLEAGKNFVVIDDTITKMIDFRVNGSHITVTDLSNISDMTKTGTPVAYYMMGVNKVFFYPTPDTDVNYSIIYVGDLKEVTLTDNSPFPNDFDDFLVEYAVIRLSVGNEFDVSQETQIMSSILEQIQNNIMGDGQPINQVSGYFDPLPVDYNSITGDY